MSKRLSALLAVVALLVLACGGSTATHSPAPTGGQTPAPTATAAPTLAASCQSDASKTPVEVQGWWTTGGEANGFNKIIAMFNDANPTTCVYNAAIAGGAGSVAQGRIKAAVLAGLPPDTFQVHMGHELLDTYVNIPGGSVMAPLDDLFAANGFNDQFPANVLAIISSDGHPYSVPLNIHRANELWYNKTIFAANNLQPPTTWAEFETAAATLKTAGVTPLAVGDSGIWANGMIFETVLIGTLGADAFLGLWTGATSWDDPKVTEALNEYKKILDPANGWINTDHSSLSWDQAADKLIDGSAAMTIMGDWANGEFTAKQFPDYGWAPAPGNADIYQALSDSFGLPVKAQHPDQTKLFLAWLGSAEAQAIFNPYKGSIAANTTSGNPPAGELQYNDYQISAAADWKTNTIVPSMEHGAAANPAWSSAINDVLTSFVTDLDVTAAQAALVTAAAGFNQ
ncbi:MAG: ABC transporter substrate-binding protein [Chloroflexota bacterium]|nr:ABC transporter substrate-binding protein [Chloroflexota bacterium]